MLIRRTFISLGAALSAILAAGPAFAQAPAPIPAEVFFAKPAFSGAKMSPDGKHVAVTLAQKNARAQLIVIDVATRQAKVAAGFKDGDVTTFDWVNNERLIYLIEDSDAPAGEQLYYSNLYAVNRDGSDMRSLTDPKQGMVVGNMGGRNTLDRNTRLVGTTRNKDSADVFVTVPVFNNYNELEARNLLRLDTITGRTSGFSGRPGRSMSWMTDARDLPRLTVTVDKGRQAVQFLDPATSQWKVLAEFDAVGGSKFMTPIGLAADGSLYVTAARGDKSALFKFDFAKGEPEMEPLVSAQDYDFSGSLVMGKTGLAGVRFTTDAQTTVWFDPHWKAVQAKVDALLPATQNLIDVPVRPETPFVVVRAYSDVDPGSYLLFNTETSKFTALGPQMRDVDPKRMAQRDLVKYGARDGMPVPAWLTIPKGGKGKKLPLVVLVHGGPWVRGGTWTWDSQSQFLASRGYAVLEPEFRGSRGLGWKHFRSSWKQWGLAMQDDIADAAKWAIAQGIADPSRVCIAGTSYGGYATLMGLVKDPELFKCGVNWAGVTDISLLYAPGWTDQSDESRTYGMPTLIGDPVADAEQLKKTSPIEQASRIKQPLLLAYGGADKRVPIVHGTRFRSAVSAVNPNVEWIEYNDEGHGWVRTATKVDFWTRVEKFLQKNIGTP